MENILKDTVFLTLNTSIQPTRNGPTSKLIRSSNLVEPNLVGKEIIHSSRKLVELVLAHKENKSYKLAIVGTGGVGKTTLAQKIYNDQKVKGRFKLHAWICVSQDYNKITLLKEVLRNIGVHHEQGESITEVQRKLAETIEGKSFFLVLDDVWHFNVWMDLLRPALHETTAGVILVTTRDDQITKRIGADHTHRVDLKSVEVGWELLWKSMNIDEEKEVQNLRNTGIEIVRKCGCLPLAIKVTASALASIDLTENEWNKYLGKYAGSQSMLSDEIEEALYLSYDELPHRLKQCFLYCAMYVEDSIIQRDEVTWLWIAEGFIEEQHGQLLEDTAEEYYYELIHRNLLQPDISYFDLASCKMHDLLRQLALNISGEECFIGDVETLRGENMSKLRRVTAVIRKDMLVVPRVDKVEAKVRTFLTAKGPWRIEDTLFKRFLLHRVLVLNYSLVRSIPDYIGKLIHLRLLNLDYTVISCLPESIGSLKNMQLTRLKFLRIDGAHAVTKVGLKFVGCKKGDLVCNELVAFPKLEWLIFTDMPNWEEWSFFYDEVAAADRQGEDVAAVIRKEDAQSARLQLLPRLLELNLRGCPKLVDIPQQLGKDTTCLQKLNLRGLNNLKAVEDFPHLSELLAIKDCEGLERVSNLPQVTELRVRGCTNLSLVDGLGSLQQLGLGKDMQEISSRWVPGL